MTRKPEQEDPEVDALIGKLYGAMQPKSAHGAPVGAKSVTAPRATATRDLGASLREEIITLTQTCLPTADRATIEANLRRMLPQHLLEERDWLRAMVARNEPTTKTGLPLDFSKEDA